MDGSPEPSSVELVRALAAGADYVVVADRGAEVLFQAGVRPNVFCGDADSVSPEVAAWAHGQASTDIRFPVEKYATDLALAIDCARHEAARQGARLHLTLTCATGGRPDHQLAVLGLPMLVGVSRKSMIWRLLDCTPQDALGGTTALNMLALSKGASILRVHDVRAAVETVKIWNEVASF